MSKTESAGSAVSAGSVPWYTVLSFAGEQSAIVAQGAVSSKAFRQQFLSRYEMGGERYHPGEGWTLHGALLATDGTSVATVPVATWHAPDGTARFLCQATDDGTPPALSVIAYSEKALLADLAARLRPSA